jgi:hypothetical protein
VGILSLPDLVKRAREQQEAANSKDQARRDNLFKPTVSLEVSWKAPSMGTVKANWDAVVDRGGGKIGIGWLYATFQGNVLLHLLMVCLRLWTRIVRRHMECGN